MASYTVQKGDTLSSIAKQYGTTYEEIAKANGISDPNLIHVGQTLKIGDTAASQPANGEGPSATEDAENMGSADVGNTTEDAGAQKYYYDSSSNETYLQAQAMLQEQLGKMPQIQGSYDQQLADIMASITGREDFSYNINEDALYQQYKDQYTRQGQLAMMDAMGQAAALGGGYGSSYAQSVGQQQYQAYLQQLNAVVPELHNAAKAQYDQEGDELLEQYSLYRDMADSELNRQQNALNNWWQNVSFLQGQADDAYSKGYTEWYNAQQMQKQDEQTAYERQQAAKAELMNLISSTGYKATDEELAAAGMTREQADAYMNYYNASKVSYGGGYTGGGGGWDNDGYDEQIVRYAQKAVGATQDGKWGPDSAAKAKARGFDSLEAVLDAYGLAVTKDEDDDIIVNDAEGVSDNIRARAAGFTNNADLANYLDGLDIPQEQADALYAEYRQPEQVALKDRTWVLKDNGGINWGWGIDNNATVTDQYKNTYRLDKLVTALIAEGMSKADAQEYVKTLQAKLGA